MKFSIARKIMGITTVGVIVACTAVLCVIGEPNRQFGGSGG